MGLWYEIYRSSNSALANGECVTAYLKDVGDGWIEAKVSHQEYYLANKNFERTRDK